MFWWIIGKWNQIIINNNFTKVTTRKSSRISLNHNDFIFLNFFNFKHFLTLIHIFLRINFKCLTNYNMIFLHWPLFYCSLLAVDADEAETFTVAEIPDFFTAHAGEPEFGFDWKVCETIVLACCYYYLTIW